VGDSDCETVDDRSYCTTILSPYRVPLSRSSLLSPVFPFLVHLPSSLLSLFSSSHPTFIACYRKRTPYSRARSLFTQTVSKFLAPSLPVQLSDLSNVAAAKGGSIAAIQGLPARFEPLLHVQFYLTKNHACF